VLPGDVGSVAFPTPERPRITFDPGGEFLLGHAAASTQKEDLTSDSGVTGEGDIPEEPDYPGQKFDAGIAEAAFPKLEGGEVNTEVVGDLCLLEAQVETPLFDVLSDGVGLVGIALNRLQIPPHRATHPSYQ